METIKTRIRASSWGHHNSHMPRISAHFPRFWAIAGQGRKLRPIRHSTELHPPYRSR
jgi:hypothetical protein